MTVEEYNKKLKETYITMLLDRFDLEIDNLDPTEREIPNFTHLMQVEKHLDYLKDKYGFIEVE